MQKLVATSLATLMLAGNANQSDRRGCAIGDHNTDQASGGDLPGKYLLQSSPSEPIQWPLTPKVEPAFTGASEHSFSEWVDRCA